LLTALAKSRLRATMFNEGRFAAADPAGVRAEASAGMWIGNHSYTHPHLTQSGKAQIDAEISAPSRPSRTPVGARRSCSARRSVRAIRRCGPSKPITACGPVRPPTPSAAVSGTNPDRQ
jgi:hypothetical protein